MREFTFDDLRCRHFTGRSYIKSGEGRNRVYGYRTGIQCDLGNIEQSEWFQMVRELIDCKGERHLYEQLLEYLTEHNYAMVSRAYLHNLDIFDAFQFGVGDEIMVYKANQIIPQIAENKTKSGTFKMPMACPCCGEKLIVRTTPGGSRQMYCENPYCAAKLIRKFTHFCEKTRMNIEGLSQTTLSKFLGHGWIRNFGDLYELEKYRDEFLQTPGFGEKSFERLLASIEKSRHCTLAKFIAGLGIPMVGRHAGRDLDRYFGGAWEAFEQAIQDGFDFTQLHDFGETMNNNIYIWYADAEEANLWRPLLNHIEFVKETSTMTTNTTNPFAGKTVVATGKLMN